MGIWLYIHVLVDIYYEKKFSVAEYFLGKLKLVLGSFLMVLAEEKSYCELVFIDL